MKLLLTYFLFSTSFFAIGQKHLDSLEYELIRSTAIYRNNLLANSKDNIENLKDLQQRWKEVEPDQNVLDYILFNATIAIGAYDSDATLIRKKINKFVSESPLKDFVSDYDIEIIKQNADILLFANDGFLNYKYPFGVSLDSAYLEEIKFLNIQNGESLADIGSGTGSHILLLSMMYPENDFIINEIDNQLLNLIKNRIALNSNILDTISRKLILVNGSRKQTNSPRKVDIMLLRNSFHHFSKKLAMLESIDESLYDDGRVILVESLRGSKQTRDDCESKMHYDSIIKIIKKSSFKINREVVKDRKLLLELVKKSSF